MREVLNMELEDTATMAKVGLLVLVGFGVMCVLIVAANLVG
jgi:hypothetical protein